MAAPIISGNAVLNTTVPQKKGFNDMIFIGSHNWFPERVRVYTSKTAVAEDMPTDSFEYIAANAAFSQPRPPSKFYIGRRDSSVVIVPTVIAENQETTIVVTVNDGDYVSATFTAGVADTAEEIVDALKAAIDGNVNVAAHITTTKTGTGAATTLTIAATTATDVFSLSGLDNITYTYTSTETATGALTAIRAESDAWYALASSDHTETFVLEMAGAIQGLRKKYFVSTQQVTSISTAYSEIATDIIAKLKQLNYSDTACFWSNDADTTLPEVAYWHMSGVYTPGEVTWVNLPLTGYATARNPNTGLVLSDTEQTNLDNRNCSYMRTDPNLGVDFVEGGKTCNGEWIDVERFADYWPTRLEEAGGIIMINQRGSKLGGDRGISKILSAFKTMSDTMVSDKDKSRGLDSYKFNVPRAKDITVGDKASRVLVITGVGYLTGAIHKVQFEVNLTYEGLV